MTEAEWIYWVAQVIRFPALITSWLYLGGWSTGAPNVTPLRNKGLIYLLCLYSGKPMLNKLFLRPYFWWVGCSQQGRLIGQNLQISAAGGGAATFDSCMDDGLLGSGNELLSLHFCERTCWSSTYQEDWCGSRIGPRYMCGKDQEFTKPHGFLNSSRFEWPGHESFYCLRVSHALDTTVLFVYIPKVNS